MKNPLPQFHHLKPAECRGLLRRHHVGRIAFTFKDRVDIEPISYVFNGQWLYARSAIGTKLRVLRRHPWVAFEVDEVDGAFDWRSVVVHGTVYFLSDGPGTRAAYTRAMKILRTLDPRALTADDPVPERSIVFRIYVDDIAGRAATTRRATGR
ncbi:MAG: pyridoxamine 5'-phosphate oxidase family protein [Gemmatimonadaceae bacterium]